MLGEEQLNWLKDSLKDSMATWKIISSYDPFGIVTGRPGDWVVLAKKILKFLGVNLN
jgi:Phosphodiesterase/alkaline phosphatase D